METGWDRSARAWLVEQGEEGDWGRRFVLDRLMLGRVRARRYGTALDVGCGEGRFCRMLAAEGIVATGLDPTKRLIDEARRRDPQGAYVVGVAESSPFADAVFDLVVSYLSLIDIADFRGAIGQTVRVLAPGGTLLIANLTSFNTAGGMAGWVRRDEGQPDHFVVDDYLDEKAERVAWRGIDIVNWHRPLSAYMRYLLGMGLRLTFFDEPAPEGYPPEDAAKAARYRRVPYFLVMEWTKPGGDSEVPAHRAGPAGER